MYIEEATDVTWTCADKAQITHTVCMVLAWAFIAPFGFFASRYLRKCPHHREHWLIKHQVAMSLTLILTLIGWGLALYYKKAASESIFWIVQMLRLWLGWSLVVGVVLQVLVGIQLTSQLYNQLSINEESQSLLGHPHLSSECTMAMVTGHHALGIGVIFLGILHVSLLVYDLKELSEELGRLIIVWFIYLYFMAMTFFFLEIKFTNGHQHTVRNDDIENQISEHNSEPRQPKKTQGPKLVIPKLTLPPTAPKAEPILEQPPIVAPIVAPPITQPISSKEAHVSQSESTKEASSHKKKESKHSKWRI